MDKLQECANLKYKIGNKEINDRFKVPMRTLQNWNKDNEFSSWRSKLLCELKMFCFLEEEAKKRIEYLFKPNELEAIKASLISTLVGEEFFTTRELFSFHFEESCRYEPMMIEQFCDEVGLEVFCKAVSSKLLELGSFEKYVLIEMIRK